MNRRPRRAGPARLLARVLLISALASGALTEVAATEAANAETDGPEYVARLRMPSRLDALGYSRAVAADLHTGEIFVCDSRKGRIVIFDRQGLFLYQIPGGESFRAPVDLAVDPDGYILLLANVEGQDALLKLDFDGKPLGEVTLSGLPADLAPPKLVSLALDASGERLYLLDEANQRLWLAGPVPPEGGTRKIVVTVSDSVDLAAAVDLSDKEAREYRLGHVDVYDNTVLVAMPNAGSVRLFNLEGRPRGGVGIKGTAPCQTAFPIAAALGADGNVVVLDWQRMLFTIWDPRSRRCLGETAGIGNAPGYLYQPSDLALDAAGRIYVSQGFEGRVQVFAGGSPAAGTAESD